MRRSPPSRHAPEVPSPTVADLARKGVAYGDEIGAVGALYEMIARGRPAWMRDAACHEAPPAVTFFPARGEDPRPAKQICDRCLVLYECRAWSLRQGSDLEGIWGGLSKRDRARYRAARAA